MSTVKDHAADLNATAQAEINAKASQLSKFFDDVEELVSRVTSFDDADISRVRRRVEGSIASARAVTQKSVKAAISTTTDAAKATDDYVTGNPWTAVGIAAVIGLAIGALSRSRRS